jgi:hypothetical protein
MTDLIEDMARAIKLFGPPSFEGAARACLSIVCARLRNPDEGLLNAVSEWHGMNDVQPAPIGECKLVLRALADYLEGKGK